MSDLHLEFVVSEPLDPADVWAISATWLDPSFFHHTLTATFKGDDAELKVIDWREHVERAVSEDPW